MTPASSNNSLQRAVRYDPRGHGQTGPSDLSTYMIDGFAADVERLRLKLGLVQPIVCGISLGGVKLPPSTFGAGRRIWRG